MTKPSQRELQNFHSPARAVSVFFVSFISCYSWFEFVDPNIQPSNDLNGEQARLAYSIINSLLEHTRIVGDLIAVMAQALDTDTQKALTQTPHWAAYLESRRVLERTREDVEKFAEIMKKLSEE